MKNKGQMFLITAAIIIVILVLLKTGINLPEILQREKELKSRFEKEFFSNIVDELVKVIDISYHQSSNITNNIFDFGNFTRKRMTERLQTFKFLYVDSMTPASNGSDTMNVTVINLLNEPISATLRLNNSEGGLEEMLPTYAWNESDGRDIIASINKSDNTYATEGCSGLFCITPNLRFNFTTSETYDNVTIEWKTTPGDILSDLVDLYCWNGTYWNYLFGSVSTTDVNYSGSISVCDNSDGNYTFKVFGTDTDDGSISIFVDYIWINKTSGDTVKSSGMADSTRWDTNFTITQGENYILTVSYDGTYEETVTIATEANESKYVGFFDINLIDSETTYKDKFQKSYTLP